MTSVPGGSGGGAHRIAPGELPARVDEMRQLANRDPGAARVAVMELLVAARQLVATEAGDLAYLAARLAAELGEPEEALRLIAEAEARFRRDGRTVDADRCDLGRMHVLDDLGRHDEAIEAGERLLDAFAASTDDAGRAVLADAAMNLGNALSRQGHFDRALASLHGALAHVDDDDVERRVRIDLNLADVLTELGRLDEALARLEAAWGPAMSHGLDIDAACIARNAGEATCRAGRPDEGLAWFRRAFDLVGKESADEIGLGIDLADALARLGCVEEAAERFDAAAAASERRGLVALTARARWGAGAAWAALGAARRAEAALSRAADAYEAAGNVPMGALVELERAVLDSRAGRSADAIARLERLADELDPSRWPIQACLTRLRLGIELGASHDAEAHLVVAHRLAEQLTIPQLRYQTEAALGTWCYDQGWFTEAEDRLQRAVAHGDDIRGRLRHEVLARAFPAELAPTAALLVAVRAGQGDTDGALAASEAAKRQSLGERPARVDAAARSIRLEAELDRRYDALLGLTGHVPGGDSPLDDEVRALESELRQARVDDALRTPTAGLQIGDEVAIRPTQFICYHDARDQVLVFVGNGQDLVARRLDEPPGEVRRAVHHLHSAARRAPTGAGTVQRPDPLHRAVAAHLARLGSILLDPIEDVLGTLRPGELVVVPHGAIYGVPFGALPFGNGTTMGDRFGIVTAPSFALWARCAATARSGGHTLLAAVDDGGLVGVLEEAELVSRVAADATVLIGPQATLGAVDHELRSTTTCLHLAAHGLFRPFAPDRSGVRLADGWLTASRASALPLTGVTVVLSACDTGRTVASPGDQVMGLARGFLLGGASSVLGCLWPADDTVTSALMVEFHRHLSTGATAPTALARAQQHVRRERPEPVWWAGFALTGAGSGVDPGPAAASTAGEVDPTYQESSRRAFVRVLSSRRSTT
jgi:tetratricopeptide (TPR) repeat protein